MITPTIFVEPINDVFIRVYSDPGIEAELSEFFCFDVPGARFTPKYRSGLWNGKAYLYSAVKKTLYKGLFNYLRTFCTDNGYELRASNLDSIQDDSISRDEIEKYCVDLNCYSKGQPIVPRDYQVELIYQALKQKRMIGQSPTSSGKSLALYILIRYHLDQGRRILLIVPRSMLVEQMFSDFEDYSSHNNWSADENCQRIYTGYEKNFDKPVTITTWQSIHKQPLYFFKKNQWDVVLGDEAHSFASAALISIMEKLIDTPYRLGVTGTVSNRGAKINTLTLEGLFGSVIKIITTKQLMEQNKIAQLKINQLVIKHPDEHRKLISRTDYQSEMDFIVSNMKRNSFISNLATACTGNTLILTQYVEKHCDVLFNMLNEKIGHKRPVFIIHGGVSVEDREDIRKKLEKLTDCILVSTFGTFSTGVNAPSIENIIFASPSKSSIRTLQSIGRGLRLKEGKTHCKLFDLVDDFSWKKKHNHTLKHGTERYHIYNEEQFQIKLTEVNI